MKRRSVDSGTDLFLASAGQPPHPSPGGLAWPRDYAIFASVNSDYATRIYR
jgi:hypothetical protein